ncbi:Endoplasmic reticulum resident protein 44, partial [Fragariocoptes setiger]
MIFHLISLSHQQRTANYQIIVLNFYADWCPFSARWKPIFQETARQVYNETLNNNDPYQIVFGQINCEVETTLSQRFRINKFPTTKLLLSGKASKKEYRGARTAEAFKEYVRKFLTDPIVYVDKYMGELVGKVDERKGAVVLYSLDPNDHLKHPPQQSAELRTFRRVAQHLREDCQFFEASGQAAHGHVTQGESHTIIFKPHHSKLNDPSEIRYPMSLTDFENLHRWIKDNCIPLVREITFENAEEMTEEGLPFVILFYDPNDKSHIDIFKKVVNDELRSETSSVTFLIADGHVFSHPLKHLGKTVKDLPLVAIDSFKHLFLFKKPISEIGKPGQLKQFVLDLHSGKLDREWHFGPDPAEATSNEIKQTSPPDSAFLKLAPSPNRYTLMRDEL